jgi:hypothetical protein
VYVTNKNKMPRNHFRPFSLKDAFSSDVSSSIVDTSSEIAVPMTTTSLSNKNDDVLIVMSTGTIDDSGSLYSSKSESTCGCKRCSMRGGCGSNNNNNNLLVSNEDLDKKLNWILTLVIFMFIILIVHVRSQTTKSRI